MASPPSNYNPEVSMLSGGTSAPILPVQGGGFMSTPPSGFNPSVSLLDGGNSATILPVQGGGKGVRFAANGAEIKETVAKNEIYNEDKIKLKDTPVRKEKIKNQSIPKATIKDVKVVEQYTFENILFTPSTLASLNNTGTTKLYNDYRAKYATLKQYKTIDNALKAENVKESVDGPLYSKCSDATFLTQQLRKKVVLIKNKNPFLWIIPNIEGSVDKFKNILSLVPKDSSDPLKIAADHIVLFPEHFFSKDEETNKTLFDLFLRYKEKNNKQLFILVERTEDFKNVACSLNKKVFKANVLSASLLDLYYEPDILVIEDYKVIFCHGPLPVAEILTPTGEKKEGAKLSSILNTTNIPEEFSIVPSLQNFKDSEIENTYDIYDYDQSAANFETLDAQIVCPKDECPGFVKGIEFKHTPIIAAGSHILQKLSGDFFYLLYFNRDGLQYLKEIKAVIPSEIKNPITSEPKGSNKPTKGIVKGKPSDKIVNTQPRSEPFVKKITEPSVVSEFTASPDADIDVDTITFNLYFKPYTIRSALDEDNGVYEDWLEAKFTQSEVDFLNALHITPDIMVLFEDYYEEVSSNLEKEKTLHWQKDLADFLQSLSISQCFVDTRVLTTPECFRAKEFLKKLYYIQLKKAIQNFEQASDIGEKLLNAMKIDGIRITEITKNEFLGDIFGETFLMYYNKDKGEYFADMPKMDKDVKEVLKNIPLKEFRSANLKEVLEKIEELMGKKIKKEEVEIIEKNAAKVIQQQGKVEESILAEPTAKGENNALAVSTGTEKTEELPSAVTIETEKPVELPLAVSTGTGKIEKLPLAITNKVETPSANTQTQTILPITNPNPQGSPALSSTSSLQTVEATPLGKTNSNPKVSPMASPPPKGGSKKRKTKRNKLSKKINKSRKATK